MKTVRVWPELQNLKDLRFFFGFANFCLQCFKNYFYICTPLTTFLKKQPTFLLCNTCQFVFEQPKKVFTTLPILYHFDPKKPIFLEIDSFNFISA